MTAGNPVAPGARDRYRPGARRLLSTSAAHFVLIALLAVAAYSNSFRVPFLFDDGPQITENESVKDVGRMLNVRDLLTNTRYVGYLSLGLNHRVHGGEVTGYHLVNLSIHVVNGWLLYLLIFMMFRTPALRESTFSGSSRVSALLAGLLFVSHPVQTQAVTYTVQRFASLATLFYLLALVLYARWRLRDSEGSRASSPGGILLYVGAVLAAVLAMKTKEMAFTLPLAMALYEFFFHEGRAARRLLFLAPFLLTMLIIPVGLVGVDQPWGRIIGDVPKATRVQTDMPRWDYLCTEFRVVVTYLRLVLLPVGQNLDYDYPIFRSFFDPQVMGSFLLLSCLFTDGIWLFVRSRGTGSHATIVSFGILWFFLALSVESGLVPIVDVIYEHRMYLPSAGLFAAASLALVWTASRPRNPVAKGILLSLVFAIPLVLGAATFARNKVWESRVGLWEDVVRKSPGKLRGHYNLGNAYRERGLTQKAKDQYLIAMRLDPQSKDVHFNLGLTYMDEGDLDRAIRSFQYAVALDPRDADARNNLGYAYGKKGRYKEAVAELEAALRMEPNHADALDSLGSVLLWSGRVDEAMDVFRKAVTLKPDAAAFHYNLGSAYLKKGWKDKSEAEFDAAVRLDPAYGETIRRLRMPRKE